MEIRNEGSREAKTCVFIGILKDSGAAYRQRGVFEFDLSHEVGINSHIMDSGITNPFLKARKEKERQKEIEKLVARQIAENTREGLHQRFHPNGQLFHEWTVVNGKKDGVLREWNENGVLIKETPMKRGTVHGTVKQWNSKGTFLGEYKMKMGKGIVRKWNEDGSLSTEAEHFGNNTLHVKVYGDPKKKFHEAFLWKDKEVSKKKFYELLSGNA